MDHDAELGNRQSRDYRASMNLLVLPDVCFETEPNKNGFGVCDSPRRSAAMFIRVRGRQFRKRGVLRAAVAEHPRRLWGGSNTMLRRLLAGLCTVLTAAVVCSLGTSGASAAQAGAGEPTATPARSARALAESGSGTAQAPYRGWERAFRGAAAVVFDDGYVFSSSAPIVLTTGTSVQIGADVQVVFEPESKYGFVIAGDGVSIRGTSRFSSKIVYKPRTGYAIGTNRPAPKAMYKSAVVENLTITGVADDTLDGDQGGLDWNAVRNGTIRSVEIDNVLGTFVNVVGATPSNGCYWNRLTDLSIRASRYTHKGTGIAVGGYANANSLLNIEIAMIQRGVEVAAGGAPETIPNGNRITNIDLEALTDVGIRVRAANGLVVRDLRAESLPLLFDLRELDSRSSGIVLDNPMVDLSTVRRVIDGGSPAVSLTAISPILPGQTPPDDLSSSAGLAPSGGVNLIEDSGIESWLSSSDASAYKATMPGAVRKEMVRVHTGLAAMRIGDGTHVLAGAVTGQPIPVKAGHTYTMTLWYSLSNPTKGVLPTVKFIGSDGRVVAEMKSLPARGARALYRFGDGSYGAYGFGATPAPGAWSRGSVSWRVPTGAVAVTIGVVTAATGGDSNAYIDDLGLYEGIAPHSDAARPVNDSGNQEIYGQLKVRGAVSPAFCEGVPMISAISVAACNTAELRGAGAVREISPCDMTNIGQQLTLLCGQAKGEIQAGERLLLRGTFRCTANRAITVVCNGRSWVEVSRTAE